MLQLVESQKYACFPEGTLRIRQNGSDYGRHRSAELRLCPIFVAQTRHKATLVCTYHCAWNWAYYEDPDWRREGLAREDSR